MLKKNNVIGYNVYRAADGCSEEFYGFADTLAEAKELAACGRLLQECMYATADAAGHCGGLYAPDKSNEGEVAEWFGEDGYDCAVEVFAAEISKSHVDLCQGQDEQGRDFGYVSGDDGGFFFTWMPTLEATLDSIDEDEQDGDGGLDFDGVREFLADYLPETKRGEKLWA